MENYIIIKAFASFYFTPDDTTVKEFEKALKCFEKCYPCVEIKRISKNKNFHTYRINISMLDFSKMTKQIDAFNFFIEVYQILPLDFMFSFTPRTPIE